MVRSYCFVPGCTSGYRSDREKRRKEGRKNSSLFAPPRDEELFEKWKQIIPRARKELTRDDTVCELHFLDEDVERFYITKLRDGNIDKLEKGKPTLRSGAVPSIFPILSTYLSKEHVKRILPEEHEKTVKKQNKNETEFSIHDTKESSFIKVEEQISETHENATDFTFADLTKDINSITTPNSFWTVSATNNYVICAKWNSSYNPEKRVVVESDLGIKVFLKEKEANLDDCIKTSSTDQISSLLEEVDAYKHCAGSDDVAMKNCLGYLTERISNCGRPSIWCKECKRSRKQQQNAARYQGNKDKTVRYKKLYQKIVCVKRKNLRLKRKVRLLREKIESMKQKTYKASLNNNLILHTGQEVKE